MNTGSAKLKRPRRILITGSTGLVGQYLVRELINGGNRCAVLLRSPLSNSVERLCEQLSEIGTDGRKLIQAEKIVPLEGDLWEKWPSRDALDFDAVVHVAASTRFSESPDGEPARTNVEGTRLLLEWMKRAGTQEMHLVSSAYVCGQACGPVPEQLNPNPPAFHNAYERSKWESEHLCVEWARESGGRLTIHRPSVIVGDFFSGRSPKFSGFYLTVRATEFLDRALADAEASSRQSIPLRIEGRGQDCQNIVPVDYVARCMAAIINNREAHGRVYHITHPNPPSNQTIKSAMESYFGIAGGRFVAPGSLDGVELNTHERAFNDLSRSIGHYFVDTPAFERANTSAIEGEGRFSCPDYDEAALHRLMAFAQAANWGRKRWAESGAFSPCAAYFEHFLPRFIRESRVARITALSTTMRFIIEDEPNGQWVCCFEKGQLQTVHRGENSIHEDFGYRSSRAVFWEAIAGRTHPQELFLSGRAELFGNMERAMKMSMILHEFTREYPCNPKLLAQMESRG